MDKIKRFGKLVIGLGIALLGYEVWKLSFPLAFVPGILGIIGGLTMSKNAYLGNKINNNAFYVKRNNKIDMVKEKAFSLRNFLSLKLAKNKEDYKNIQRMNIISQVSSLEKSKNVGMRSNEDNVLFLKKLEELGYIKDLETVPYESKSKFFTKWIDSKRKKVKEQKYDSIFTLTGKSFDKEAMKEISGSFGIDTKEYRLSKDKTGAVKYKMNIKEPLKKIFTYEEKELIKEKRPVVEETEKVDESPVVYEPIINKEVKKENKEEREIVQVEEVSPQRKRIMELESLKNDLILYLDSKIAVYQKEDRLQTLKKVA